MTAMASTSTNSSGMTRAGVATAVLAGTPPGKASDRKSTRLNSSHDQISYAVFCLKKKTNKTKNITHY